MIEVSEHNTDSKDLPQSQTDAALLTPELVKHVHVAIVGTGFSGLGAAIRLKQCGYDDFMVLERASDIGGTWRDNTYPGCACDIPSNLYSFSFAPNPRWSHTYPLQREILAYLRECARRFDILPHIRWDNELQQAHWDGDELRWHITTTQLQFTADILISGIGPLTEPALPRIPGIENFEGALFHSARWRHDYDLAGKRVAVIGTGASSIQFIPQIQPHVAHLTLFQRTPPWIMPRQDQSVPSWRQKMFRWLPFTQSLVRSRVYWKHEITALGLVYQTQIMQGAAGLALHHLRRQIPDPVLRKKLTPHYVMGCKRILISDDFYPALAQPNVEVVTDAIREIHAHSVVTADGKEHEVDTIICGTGFKVIDTPFYQHIYGSDGRSLLDTWRTGISAYYGTTVAGFPNLFLLVGPNTGLGHNSIVFMIESQLTYIVKCLRMMKRHKIQAVDMLPEVQNAFTSEIQQRMQHTVWTSGCASWYLDAQGRNSALWPGFSFEFRLKTRHFDRKHYKCL